MRHFEIDFWGMPKHESPGRSTIGRFTYREVDPFGVLPHHEQMMEIEYPSRMHPDLMGIVCWAIEHDRRAEMWRLR